jgi:hypothetical protein
METSRDALTISVEYAPFYKEKTAKSDNDAKYIQFQALNKECCQKESLIETSEELRGRTSCWTGLTSRLWKSKLKSPNVIEIQVDNDAFPLLNDQFTSDLIITIGKTQFFAHRAILGRFSNKLKDIVYSNSPELLKILAKYKPEVVLNMLHFFYTSKISFIKVNIFEMAHLAHDLDLKKVIEEITRCADTLVTLENALDFIKQCEPAIVIPSFVLENALELFKQKAFLSLSSDAIGTIFNSDQLNLNEEIIFKHAVSWLQHQKPTEALNCKIKKCLRLEHLSPQFMISTVKPTKIGEQELFTVFERDQFSEMHFEKTDGNENKRLERKRRIKVMPLIDLDSSFGSIKINHFKSYSYQEMELSGASKCLVVGNKLFEIKVSKNHTDSLCININFPRIPNDYAAKVKCVVINHNLLNNLVFKKHACHSIDFSLQKNENNPSFIFINSNGIKTIHLLTMIKLFND